MSILKLYHTLGYVPSHVFYVRSIIRRINHSLSLAIDNNTIRVQMFKCNENVLYNEHMGEGRVSHTKMRYL